MYTLIFRVLLIITCLLGYASPEINLALRYATLPVLVLMTAVTSILMFICPHLIVLLLKLSWITYVAYTGPDWVIPVIALPVLWITVFYGYSSPTLIHRALFGTPETPEIEQPIHTPTQLQDYPGPTAPDPAGLAGGNEDDLIYSIPEVGNHVPTPVQELLEYDREFDFDTDTDTVLFEHATPENEEDQPP